MADLLILTEGGDGIGFGHLVRCAAIGAHFQERGGSVAMMIDYRGDGFYQTGLSASRVRWRENTGHLATQAHRHPLVLVDSYLAEPGFFSFLHQHFSKVVVLDDYNRIRYAADLIINPNPYGDSLDYGNQHARRRGGQAFVIVRDVFRNMTSRPNWKASLDRIVVTVGGVDAHALLARIAGWLSDTNVGVQLVAGSEALRAKLYDQFGPGERLDILGLLDAEAMCRVLRQADLVISACGQTLHELAVLGRPVIGICVSDDQRRNMTAYHRAGFLPAEIYWDDEHLREKVLQCVEQMHPLHVRKTHGQRGRALIDGNGVDRIVACLFELL